MMQGFPTFSLGDPSESNPQPIKNLLEAYNNYARGLQQLQGTINERVEKLRLECLRACQEAMGHQDPAFRIQEAQNQFVRSVREELTRDEHRKRSDELFQEFLNAAKGGWEAEGQALPDPRFVATSAQIVMAGALLANQAMECLKAKSA